MAKSPPRQPRQLLQVFQPLPEILDLAEGDCFNYTESEEVSDVDVVPCDDPHQNEVYAVILIPEPEEMPFPGDTRVSNLAADICLERFDEFVNRPYADSLL